MTASELIRHARREAGLTQAELGRRLGTTQTAIARLEGRGANPQVATVERALRAAGKRLTLGAAPLPASLDEAQILDRLRMTPAERARAHDAAYRNVRGSLRHARRVDDGLG